MRHGSGRPRDEETAARLAAIVESSDDAILSKTLDGTIVTWNSGAERFYGYSAAEIVGKSVGLLTPPGSEDQLETILQRIRDGHTVDHYETVRLRKDGSPVPVSLSVSPIRDEAGAVVGAATITRDITPAKRTEEALRENEQRYRLLAEATPDLIFIIGRDDRVQYVNGKAARSVGRAPDELIGAALADVFDGETYRQMAASLKAVFESGEARESESQLNYPGGRRTISTWLVPITDDDGAVSAVFGVSRDITPSKRVEEALRASEDKFKHMFDFSPVANSLTAPTGEIQVNQAFCEMVGYPKDELERTRWQDITVPEDIELTQKQLDPILAGERDSARFTKRYRRKDGAVIWADVATTLRRDEAGQPLYFMTVAVDVTERKRAEEQVLRLNAELEQRVLERTEQLQAANAELEAFAYSVSHDLRAPLRHIDGFANVLAEVAGGSLSEEGRHCLDTISSSVREMDVLIDDLLQFSRAGRIKTQINEVDMELALSEALPPFRFETAGRPIEWSIGPLPRVVGDHDLLRQVWVNLLDNAVKYTRGRSPARIEIGALEGDADRREAVFFVRDNGVGFDMRYADKLFKVFARLHSSTEFEGTGIGLANVQRIIARLGGRVWADAELDNGATLFFSLPRSKET